jgi:hypothetical protein
MGVYRGITQDNVTIQGGTAYSLNLVTPSIGGTAVLATAAEIDAVADASTRLVSASDSTLAVTVAAHDQKVIVLNRAAGSSTRVCVCAYVCMCIRVYVYVHTCMCVRVCVCVCAYVCMCIRV